MKRIFSIFLVFILTAGLLGCAEQTSANTQTTPPAPIDTASPAETAEPQPEADADGSPPVAVCVPSATVPYYAEDGTQIFYHTYQTMYLTLPDAEVADKVIIHYLSMLDSIQAEAEDIYLTAAADYDGSRDWVPYACQLLFSPTRIDHGVLSLYGTQVSYNGGGHPSRSGVSLNYDLVTGDPLTLGSIMNADAVPSDFAALVVNALETTADEYYLYDDYASTVALKFSGEESLFESFYFTDSGLCFYFDIYEIAPYASGIISVELPYDQLTGLIHDAYFPAERDSTNGQLYQIPFAQAEPDNYSSMTEALLSEEGSMLLLYTDSSAENVKIQSVTDDISQMPYTAYASAALRKNEAIVITAAENQLSSLDITYQNKNGIAHLDVNK